MHPEYKPWFVQRDPICTPFTKPWFVYGVQIASPVINHGFVKGMQFAPRVPNHGFVKGVQIAPRVQTMVCKTGMGAKLHPWFVVVGAMRAARRPPEALAVVPASLHPLYTADDRCQWLLLHTLCVMHTAVCERELVQHGSVVPEDRCSRPWKRAA